jgi:hypothetical protein
MNKMPYNLAYQEVRRRKTFARATELQINLMNLFPEKTKSQIRFLVSNCKQHIHYGYRLRPESQIVLEYLDQHRINPRTAYRWLEYLKLPEEVRMDAESGLLTKSDALKVSKNRKLKEQASRDFRFMEEARKIIKEVITYV